MLTQIWTALSLKGVSTAVPQNSLMVASDYTLLLQVLYRCIIINARRVRNSDIYFFHAVARLLPEKRSFSEI